MTVSIPGTGLSWTQKLGSQMPRVGSTQSVSPPPPQPIIAPPPVSPPVLTQVGIQGAPAVGPVLPGGQAKAIIPAWVLWSVPCVTAIAVACLMAAMLGH